MKKFVLVSIVEDIQGKLYLTIDPLGEFLTFTKQDGNTTSNFQVSKFSGIDSTYSLPENVVLLTLKSLTTERSSIRLEHLYDLLALFFT
ncbi:hypothetical protein R6Q59_009761 [Mikania micrantha]